MDPDQNTSILHTDRGRQVTMIIHTNDLPKGCSTNFNATPFPVFSRCFDTYSSICLPCIEHTQANAMDPVTMQPEPQLWFEHTSPPNNEQSDMLDKQANPKTSSETKDTLTLPPILCPSKYEKKVSFDTDKPSQNLDLHTNITPEDKAQQKPYEMSFKIWTYAFWHTYSSCKDWPTTIQHNSQRIPPMSELPLWQINSSQLAHQDPHGTIAPLATKPGDCISVDQMESSIPGFVAQNVGKLTKQRFKYATIFVDQASKLGYVHVHKMTNAEDAIKAKRAFEHYARSHSVHIKHYHADNGIFNSQEFMASVESSHQSISFCGVGAYHQSGVAEHRIREVTELVRTQLLHAIHNNPKAVNKSLWPYAL